MIWRLSKNRIAKLVTLLVVLGALGLSIARRTAASSEPTDTIYAMLDAARAGDTRGYLALYTGPMEASLKQTMAEKGEAGLKAYLRTANAEVKGVAVQEPRSISVNEVQVRVEYVYQDRNEAQTVFLEKRPEGWKIARVDSTERIKTLVPYGTPVQ